MPETRRLRVLLATDSRDPSGVGEHILTLGTELAQEHDVIVAFAGCARGDAFLQRAASLGFGIKRIDDDRAAFGAWLEQTGPDLLHLHAGIAWEGHDLALAAGRACIPVVRTEHLPYLITDPDQRRDYHRALQAVDRLIVVSDSSALTFRREGVASERLAVIRNGIATPVTAVGREAMRAGLHAEPGDLVILTVARFTPQKGHAVLLAAFKDIVDAMPSARLVLAGDGTERARMERMASVLGLDRRIAFLGDRNDVPDLLSAADLFVLPSHFEGLPLVVLEAMALGVPVVATHVGGTLEALGKAHPWLVPPDDTAALAATVMAALADAESREQLGAQGKHRFETEYQANRMGRQTAAVYRQVARPAVIRIGKSKTMQKTRIGFIGVGGIAQRHLGVLETLDDIELAAFCDLEFGRAQEAAQRYGAKAFANHSEMLASAQLDAVYICVPPFAHGPAEREVLARNLPFFVEKPLSLDLALAERLSSEIDRKGLVTAVGYHWRYLNTVDEAKVRLAETPAQLLSGYWLDATPPPQWWWRNDRSGGQMVEQATHIIDLARYLAGDIVQVFAMAAHAARPDFEGLDVATSSIASLRFASGAIGNIGATCLLGWGHRTGLHLFGDRLAIELTDHDIMIDVGAGRPVRRADGDPVWREDRDFIDAVRGNENRIRCPYREALATHRVAVAIARSAQTGIPVSFEAAMPEAAHG